MSRKIIGVTVGTPMKPQTLVDKALDYNLLGDFEKHEDVSKSHLLKRKANRVSFDSSKNVIVYGANRFDIRTVSVIDTFGNATVTKEHNGIHLVTDYSESSNRRAYTEYIAEFDGDLWISCVADATGTPMDARMIVNVNGTEIESCDGLGEYKMCIPVVKDDVVRIYWQYHEYQQTEGNDVIYKDIMIAYDNLDSYVPYVKDDSNLCVEKTRYDLPTDTSAWTSQSTSTSGMYRIKSNVAFSDMVLPSSNNAVADIEVVGDLPLIATSQTNDLVRGIGISKDGYIWVCLDGSGKTALCEWLAENPVYILYESTNATPIINQGFHHEYKHGEILEFEEEVNVSYYYENLKKNFKMVCMGDSITGMFIAGAGYTDIINRESDIEVINCGFSGSCLTDHSSSSYMPFSINRIVDAIVSGDWTLQDATVGNVTSKYYAEHLEALKEVDFSTVDFVTILAGTNDWGYGRTLLSEDDAATENKQRTNVQDAVNYSVRQLLTAYPHLRIIVLSPYWRSLNGGDSDVDANNNGDMLIDFVDTILSEAEKYNLPTVDLYRASGVNAITSKYYTFDGTHPSSRMKNVIAKHIINTVNGIYSKSTRKDTSFQAEVIALADSILELQNTYIGGDE
jgi:lysophospholipase L1-like esterase